MTPGDEDKTGLTADFPEDSSADPSKLGSERPMNLAVSASRYLQSISPVESIEWYLDAKAPEITVDTRESYRTSLEYFTEFCQNNEVTNLNTLTGRFLERYRSWRRQQSTSDTLAPKTMRDEMYLFRDFVSFLESIEAVEPGLHKKIQIPQLGEDDGVRDIQLESERATRILNYLEKFHYASLEHVLLHLLCRTGRRLGGIHSLDLGDYHPDAKNPHLTVRHRPDQGTRLKNGENGETNVNIPEETCDLLDDYLETTRLDSEDEFGRRPLLTTKHGRLTKSTMRKYVYKWSRPCEVTGECPHGREIPECEAAQNTHQASKCPSSISPHAIRHGYITSMRDAGTPKPLLSDRCDVSEAVIERHYDERSEEEKQDLRERILSEIRESGGQFYGT